MSQASPRTPTRLWPRNMDSYSQNILNDGYIDIDTDIDMDGRWKIWI